MNSPVPKQFLNLGEYPVLWHTIMAFYRYDPGLQLVLVLHKDRISYWRTLSASFLPKPDYLITAGGETRFHSVKNGLRLIETSGLTAVHDGSRPLISSELIRSAFQTAREKGNAVPVLPVSDSLRVITNDGNRPVDRSLFRSIQTPQIFPTDLLKKAFQQPFLPEFTDEATVVETLGESIHLVEGEKRNIKITTEFDLEIAKTLLYSNVK